MKSEIWSIFFLNYKYTAINNTCLLWCYNLQSTKTLTDYYFYTTNENVNTLETTNNICIMRTIILTSWYPEMISYTPESLQNICLDKLTIIKPEWNETNLRNKKSTHHTSFCSWFESLAMLLSLDLRLSYWEVMGT